MKWNIKERSEELTYLVGKAENLMEELIQFKSKEQEFSNIEHIEYAESSLDECITSLNNHYYEELS